MSMLSAPRDKKKWAADPQNSAWSKDANKFGQKMMERMGWSKGKGLGRTEQGTTENIKVKVKNNYLGLGKTVSHEDNWLAHQDDFDQLLADLNSCHGQNGSKESPAEDKQTFSLEEKSKTSKKRVHYMKFTKGKDLSNRSDTDLACIFGKRAQKEGSKSGSGSPGEKEEDGQEGTLTPIPVLESLTKTSSLTMKDYFAQRMALLKRDRDEAQDHDEAQDRDEAQDHDEAQDRDEAQSRDEAQDRDEAQNTTDDMEQPKKKKKTKRKRRRGQVEVEEEAGGPVVLDCEEAGGPVVLDCEEQERPSQRKRGEKRALLSDPGQEQKCEKEQQTPTQKKKKKQKETRDETDLVKEQKTANQTNDQEARKRKREEEVVVVDDNDDEDDDDVVEIVDDEDDDKVVERKFKKDKKKKKAAV